MTVDQLALDALWDYSDAAASETRLRSAAASAAEPDRSELLTQVARALGLQDRMPEAESVLDDVDVDAVAVAPVVVVRAALERGRLKNSAGETDAAIPLFRDAAERAASAGLVFLHVDALHMLAIADSAHAERWTRRALDVLASTDDPRTRRWTVSLHNNLGWALFDAGRIADGVAELERAKAAAVRWGTAQQITWADEALDEARAALDDPSS